MRQLVEMWLPMKMILIQSINPKLLPMLKIFLLSVQELLYIILTDNPSQPPYYRLSEKVHVVQLDIRYEELWDANFFKKVFLYLKKQIKYKLLLRRYLYVIKPDISVSCMRREINFITTIHDGSKKIAELHINKSNLRRFDTSPYDSGPSLLYNKIIPRLWNRTLISKLRKLSKFITLSEEDAKHWKELNNVAVIPDPIPFLPEKISDCSVKRVIAVGRYVPQKGFDILLNIWKKLEDKFPNWELCIYGPGEIDFYKKISAREPFIHRDQNVLDDRIRMDRLRNVAETVAARPDNTEIFADERLRIREMLRESLMKHKVERTVRKRSVKSVPAD